jgi:putative sigma-54 modulation protein
MDATDALKQYARDRMERIRKYFPDPIACHVVMSTERFNHRVDVNLQLHNGIQIAGHETTEDMYSSVDLVVAKIERQVRRYKGKLRSHKVRTDLPPVQVSHSVLHETPEIGSDLERENAEPLQLAATARASEPQALGASPAASDLAGLQIVRKEQFDAQPMTAAQAIMQLNLIHGQFLVYCAEDTGSVNVIYRREDGTYGLIETGAQSHSDAGPPQS